MPPENRILINPGWSSPGIEVDRWAALPTEPAEALALLSPEMRQQIEMFLPFVDDATQRAVLAAVPQIAATIEAGDYPGFVVALGRLGLDPFAPLIWGQARAYYPGE